MVASGPSPPRGRPMSPRGSRHPHHHPLLLTQRPSPATGRAGSPRSPPLSPPRAVPAARANARMAATFARAASLLVAVALLATQLLWGPGLLLARGRGGGSVSTAALPLPAEVASGSASTTTATTTWGTPHLFSEEGRRYDYSSRQRQRLLQRGKLLGGGGANHSTACSSSWDHLTRPHGPGQQGRGNTGITTGLAFLSQLLYGSGGGGGGDRPLDVRRVLEAERAWRSFMASGVPAYERGPGVLEGARGVVTSIQGGGGGGSGGGFRRLLLLLRMLRFSGCTLPVEVWYWPGQLDGAQQAALAGLQAVPRSTADMTGPFTVKEPSPDVSMAGDRPVGGGKDGVTAAAAATTATAAASPATDASRRGRNLKSAAIMNSNFEEVLWMDAVTLPAHDPTYLFDTPQYRSTGAVFFPGQWRTHSHSQMYQIMKVPCLDEPEFEGGQMVLDKTRGGWRGLALTWFMGSQRQWRDVYGGILGGEDDAGGGEVFRFAWKALGLPYHLVGGYPASAGFTFERDGRRLFCGHSVVQHDPMAASKAQEQADEAEDAAATEGEAGAAAVAAAAAAAAAEAVIRGHAGGHVVFVHADLLSYFYPLQQHGGDSAQVGFQGLAPDRPWAAVQYLPLGCLPNPTSFAIDEVTVGGGDAPGGGGHPGQLGGDAPGSNGHPEQLGGDAPDGNGHPGQLRCISYGARPAADLPLLQGGVREEEEAAGGGAEVRIVEFERYAPGFYKLFYQAEGPDLMGWGEDQQQQQQQQAGRQ